MKKIIPKTTKIFCDKCKKQCGLETEYKKEAFLNLQQHALDMYGSPAANGARQWDLCDKCVRMVEDFIDNPK